MSVQQIHRFGIDFPWVDVRLYASFSAAIDAIGATEKTLLIPNQQNVTDDKTVPINVTLKFLQGGSLNISTTKTVTINGHVEAGLYQIFQWSGTGAVVFGTAVTKEVYPQWWGAKGDGTTDDTTLIQAALTSLASGGIVYFPSGTYKLTAALTLPTKVMMIGNGMDVTTLDWSTFNGTGAVITSDGTKSAADLLTADVAAGATTVSVTSGTGIAVGDMLLLGSDDLFKAIAGAKKGEIVFVRSIDALVLTLTTPTIDAYTTANAAKVYKLTPVEDIGVQSLTIKREAQIAASRRAITFNIATRVLVKNIRVQNATGYGIYYINVFDGAVEGCSIDNSWYTGTGTSYSVVMVDACMYIRVINNYMRKFRHAVSIGKTAAEGVPRFITVQGNTAWSETSSGTVGVFDSHGQSQYVSFIGNTAYSAEGYGISCNGFDQTVSGNIIHAPARGIQCYDSEGTNTTITGNKINICSGGSGTPTGILLRGTGNYTVVGNEISGAGLTNGIQIQRNPTNNPTSNVVISGNTIGPLLGSGILIYGGVDVLISNNHIKQPASLYGVWINANGTQLSNRIIISGNLIIDAQETPTMSRGILSSNGPHSNVVIQGNLIVGSTVTEVGITDDELVSTYQSPLRIRSTTVGNAIVEHLTGTAVYDPPSVAASGTTTTTVTVTGAVVGDTVTVGFSNSLSGLVLTGYVSATNTVTCVLFNPTGGAIDLASGTLRADVWQH